MKVGVVDHRKIPKWTRVATPKLLFYNVYFQLEEIVEEGWERPEDEIMQDFEDIPDSQIEEKDGRDPKKLKMVAESSGNAKQDELPGEKEVVASTKTRIAMEQREMDLKLQEEEDARILRERNSKKEGANKKAVVEEIGDNSEDNNIVQDSMDRDKDTESMEEDEVDDDQSETVIFATRVGLNMTDAQGGAPEGSGADLNPRFSDRLASKNNDDIPMLDRAKNLTKTKNLEKNEGITPIVLNSSNALC